MRANFNITVLLHCAFQDKLKK